MTRKEEERLVKELNIMTSKLLECYQWDHLSINYLEVKKQYKNINNKLIEFHDCLTNKEFDTDKG